MTMNYLSSLFSKDFTGREFQARRQRIAVAIGPDASALLQGAPAKETAHPRFSQSKVFYYVCGLELERSYLLIDGQTARTTLFVPPDKISNVPGGVLDAAGVEAIRAQMLIDEVVTLDALEKTLESVRTLYVLHEPDEHSFSTKFGIMSSARYRAADPLDRYLRRDEMLVRKLKELYPKTEIGDLCPIIEEMRLIKSGAEIAVMRKTGELSARMCIECMKATRPGLPRRSMEAIGDFVFRFLGDCGAGYDFEATTSHSGAETLLDGDLVLVDCGPDYNHYSMDIGRIWPVNGNYDAWQRHTCGLITEYHKTLLELAGPGKLVRDIYDEAAKIMLKKYENDETGTAMLRNMIARDVGYFNHHVGMSVHDAVGKSWKDAPLKPGMVLVVDPMIWQENVPHGYVRVEDTIVITESGHERLTGSAPIELDEIEALMAQPSGFPLSL